MINCRVDSNGISMTCAGNISTILTDIAHITCEISAKLPKDVKSIFRAAFISGALDGVFFNATKDEMSEILNEVLKMVISREDNSAVDKLLDDLASVRKELKKAQDELEKLKEKEV